MTNIEKTREYLNQLLDEKECVLRVGDDGRIYLVDHYTLERAIVREY